MKRDCLYIGALLMKKVGLRTLLGIGAAVFASGMILWSVRLTPDISDAQMYLPLILTGFGAARTSCRLISCPLPWA